MYPCTVVIAQVQPCVLDMLYLYGNDVVIVIGWYEFSNPYLLYYSYRTTVVLCERSMTMFYGMSII